MQAHLFPVSGLCKRMCVRVARGWEEEAVPSSHSPAQGGGNHRLPPEHTYII